MELNEFKKMMRERGFDEDEVEEAEKEMKKSLHILTFKMDNKGCNITSQINRTIVFVSNGFQDKVSVGDTWICTVVFANGVYYATPIEKITPSLLINFDSTIRDKAIERLWLENRNIFENEFAEKYKNEITNIVQKEMEKEYGLIVEKLQREKKDLESQLEHFNRAMQNGVPVISDSIELGSEEDEGIELTSEGNKETVAHVKETYVPPSVPRSAKSVPGFPEFKKFDYVPSPTGHVKYNVERTGENTIRSDSFTDLRYFVHISPDCKMLVIRQNDYGNAININGTITLNGLQRLAKFTERKKLDSEYSEKYDGMIVHL